MITRFEWLSTGYCTALEAVGKRGGALKQVKFPAMFGVFEHSVKGTVLFDTGYSMRFFDASAKYPYKLYRHATPVFTEPGLSAAAQLKTRGIAPEKVEHILLSHFHGDHVGGLKDFPNAQFYCTEEAYAQWKGSTGFQAVRHGLLPDLFPDDFERRCTRWHKNAAAEDTDFGPVWDVFGDASLEAVYLPGHGRGQTGLRFLYQGRPYFLVADAAWFTEAVTEMTLPHPVVRLFFDDWKAYKTTLERLHRYARANPEVQIIPTHCNLKAGTTFGT